MRRLLAFLVLVTLWVVPAAAQPQRTDNVTSNGDCNFVQLNGRAGFTVSVTNTFTGQLDFTATADGGDNPFPIRLTNWATGVSSTFTEGTGDWYGGGTYDRLRVCGSSWSSGTATVAISATLAPTSVDVVRQVGDVVVLDPDNYADDTSWAVLNDASSGKTTNTDSVTEEASLEFDKVDGTGFTVAGLDRTISSTNLCHAIGWYFEGIVKVSDLTDAVNVIVRLGSSDSAYNEWQYPVADFDTGRWNQFRIWTAETVGGTGAGWDCLAVTYLFVGVEFGAEDDTLDNIRIDDLRLVRGDPGQLTNLDLKDLLDDLVAKTNTISGWTVSGGLPGYNLDVDQTEDDIKTSAAELYMLCAINLSSSKLYVKLYNDTAANVTVGMTTPSMTITVPTLGDTNGAGICPPFVGGVSFTTALSIAATTGFADNDTGAPGANEMLVIYTYK